MNEPTNADLYGVLLGIREDIGGLKANSYMQVQALENHGKRIVVLEDGASRQRGAAKVWTLVGSGIGALLGGAGAIAAAWFQGKH